MLQQITEEVNMTCGKNINDTLGYTSYATFLFLPYFNVIFDLLLNRRMATQCLYVFVKYTLTRKSSVSRWFYTYMRKTPIPFLKYDLLSFL